MHTGKIYKLTLLFLVSLAIDTFSFAHAQDNASKATLDEMIDPQIQSQAYMVIKNSYEEDFVGSKRIFILRMKSPSKVICIHRPIYSVKYTPIIGLKIEKKVQYVRDSAMAEVQLVPLDIKKIQNPTLGLVASGSNVFTDQEIDQFCQKHFGDFIFYRRVVASEESETSLAAAQQYEKSAILTSTGSVQNIKVIMRFGYGEPKVDILNSKNNLNFLAFKFYNPPVWEISDGCYHRSVGSDDPLYTDPENQKAESLQKIKLIFNEKDVRSLYSTCINQKASGRIAFEHYAYFIFIYQDLLHSLEVPLKVSTGSRNADGSDEAIQPEPLIRTTARSMQNKKN